MFEEREWFFCYSCNTKGMVNIKACGLHRNVCIGLNCYMEYLILYKRPFLVLTIKDFILKTKKLIILFLEGFKNDSHLKHTIISYCSNITLVINYIPSLFFRGVCLINTTFCQSFPNSEMIFQSFSSSLYRSYIYFWSICFVVWTIVL